MTWRPPGIPPYTIAEETVIDLAQAAAAADDVVALVTRGYGRRLLAEHQLLRLSRARKKLRWRRELDGRRFHPDEQRGRDTERDNQAAVAGATLRYGWDDVTRKACETAEQEAAALRNRGWTGTLTPCSPSCRAVNGYGSSARSTAAVSARSGSTASAPAMARSSAE
jgi:hypothetical protein